MVSYVLARTVRYTRLFISRGSLDESQVKLTVAV